MSEKVSAAEMAAQLAEQVEEVSPDEIEEVRPEDAVPDLEGMEFAHLFAADVEPVEKRFRIKGAKNESCITFRPMDADKMAKFREAAARGLATEAEYICLEHTIEDVEIYFPNRQAGGRDQKQPYPANARLRRDFFERMTPDLRIMLYLECLKVNGLDPNQ